MEARHLQEFTTIARVSFHRSLEGFHQCLTSHIQFEQTVVERQHCGQIEFGDVANGRRCTNAAALHERNTRIGPILACVTNGIRINHGIGDQIAQIAFEFATTGAVQKDFRCAEIFFGECIDTGTIAFEQCQYLRITFNGCIQNNWLTRPRQQIAVTIKLHAKQNLHSFASEKSLKQTAVTYTQYQFAHVLCVCIRLNHWNLFATRLSHHRRIWSVNFLCIRLLTSV